MKKSKRRKKESFSGVPKPPVKPIVSVEKPQDNPKRRVTKAFIIGCFIVMIIALGSLGVYIFAGTRDNASIPYTANLESAQVEQLIEKVSSLIEIPKNEMPIMALVSDATTLKKQPFFKNAQNGDRVLIFKSTKQAILYRTSTNKIIAATIVTDREIESFESLTKGQGQGSPSASTNVEGPDTKLNVVILNSTQERGLARKGAGLLDKDKYEVISTANSQGEYKNTIIANVSGTKNITDESLIPIASSFADISATIGSLPPDEAAPAGADIVVILGEDFSEAY